MKKDSEYSISSRILFRGKLFLDSMGESWSNYVRFKMSRDSAHRIRRRVVTTNGREVVDRNLMKTIRAYCKHAFGSPSYWPWLALYTELRGEFKEGWMPDDYYRFELLPTMNPEKFMKFSEAKTIDHKLFNGSIIEPLLFRSNGLFYNSEGLYKKKSEVQELFDGMDTEIIIKPDDGRSGKRIFFKDSKDLNLEDLPPDTDLLFQKVVKQHSELNRLHPHSVNTFRVFTFIDQEGCVNTKFITLRFGIDGTRVDNTGSGGGWTLVDLNGNIEPNAYDKFGLDIGKKHPDTGMIYSNLDIPNFHKIITICERAHRTFPYTRIIGWDIFLNEKAEPMLIEWNANKPGFWVAEALFGPFFSDLVG